MNLANCYNNYIYNYIDISQVLEFEFNNMIAKLVMIYKRILEYLELQLFIKHDYLHIINLQNPKTMAKQVLIYKIALVGFVI